MADTRHGGSRQRSPVGSRKTSRRGFLSAGLSAAAFTIVPRSFLAGGAEPPPSERIALGCIGVGSQGTRVLMSYLARPDVQVVSVCDVDKGSPTYVQWGDHEMLDAARRLIGDGFQDNGYYTGKYTAGREPAKHLVEACYAVKRGAGSFNGCSAWRDYREMLEAEKSLDAVLVATPDHAHAAVSVACMRKGKHVHCQKPMAHSVHEARRMAEVARETKTATQVATGNQASEATRVLTEWIRDGAIGTVREVHNWSNRPIWPQGIERPRETPPVPPELDWDLWLGPAPARPYHPAYLPFVWRGWCDFGTGALGDMGCYSLDTVFRVLDLDAPTAVEASSTKVFPDTYPLASVVRWWFPERGERAPVKLVWYDGGILPERPAELWSPPGGPVAPVLEKEGLLFVGDRGKVLCRFHGEEPRILPQERSREYVRPQPTLPRSPGHDEEWLRACRGKGPAPGANFEFAARVTETLALGNLAVRTGKRLLWDAAAARITNDDAANALVAPAYRAGWTL